MKPITAFLTLAAMAALAVAPAAAVACGKQSLPDEPYEEFLKEGYFRDRQGDYRGAIDIFKRAIAMRPTNRKVRYLIANTYWRDNQWTNARYAWETVLRMGPDDKIGKEARAWLKEFGKEAWVPAVQTVAGGVLGFADGPGGSAKFNNPNGMAISGTGNLYVTDTGNHRIRRVATNGHVTTLAGHGEPGWEDGPAHQARLFAPVGGALDPVGNYYFADGFRIRFVTPNGLVGTLAGDGAPGWVDGVFAGARFSRPLAVATDWRGYVMVADNGTAVRMVSPQGEVRTVVGGPEPGWADGVGGEAKFRYITSMKMLDKNTLLVVDTGNNRIREVHIPTGRVRTHVGCSVAGYIDGPLEIAHFKEMSGLVIDRYGNLLVADSGNRAIRRITVGQEVQTLAGGFVIGNAFDGMGIWARFMDPSDLAIAGQTLFILDRKQHAVRKMVLGRLYI